MGEGLKAFNLIWYQRAFFHCQLKNWFKKHGSISEKTLFRFMKHTDFQRN